MGFAARVNDALGPAVHRRGGELVQALVEGLTAELEYADDNLVGPTARGWSPALDVDQSVFLAWLGRTLGTPIPVGLSSSEQRDFIRDRGHERRGAANDLKPPVSTLLADYGRVDIYERHEDNAWRFLVRVYESQAAGVTTEQIRAALEPVKPLGLVADVEVAAGASYAHMAANHGPTFADYTATFATFDAARTHTPEAVSAEDS